jgi:hypothetical protein
MEEPDMTRLTTMVILAGAAAVLIAALFVAAPAPASSTPTAAEPYRVELVSNDVYKVQKALNANAAQGWWYVSGIERSDGKVLLVFRSAH